MWWRVVVSADAYYRVSRNIAVVTTTFGPGYTNTMDDLDQVQTWVDDGARGTLVVDLRISRNIVAPYILEIIELMIKR